MDALEGVESQFMKKRGVEEGKRRKWQGELNRREYYKSKDVAGGFKASSDPPALA
jgi:hypothetical protein